VPLSDPATKHNEPAAPWVEYGGLGSASWWAQFNPLQVLKSIP
jgi:hypothetical protein